LKLFEIEVLDATKPTGERSCSCENGQIVAWAMLPRQQELLLDISEHDLLLEKSTFFSDFMDSAVSIGQQKLAITHVARLPSAMVFKAHSARELSNTGIERTSKWPPAPIGIRLGKAAV
jgi:hypothetical protein